MRTFARRPFSACGETSTPGGKAPVVTLPQRSRPRSEDRSGYLYEEVDRLVIDDLEFDRVLDFVKIPGRARPPRRDLIRGGPLFDAHGWRSSFPEFGRKVGSSRGSIVID
jgi:hypothetical protein